MMRGARPSSVQAERMIQPGSKDRRGPAVVLRRAQHDDRVDRPALVLLAHHQDHDQRHSVDDPGGQKVRPSDEADRRRSVRTADRWPQQVERFPVLRHPHVRTPSSRRMVGHGFER